MDPGPWEALGTLGHPAGYASVSTIWTLVNASIFIKGNLNVGIFHFLVKRGSHRAEFSGGAACVRSNAWIDLMNRSYLCLQDVS